MFQILDSQVIPRMQIDDEDQVDDSCVLYCERFMEFLIDLLSQLPTRRYSEYFYFPVVLVNFTGYANIIKF